MFLALLAGALGCGSHHPAALALCGTVVDAGSGAAVAGAELFVAGLATPVRTDAHGRFRAVLPAGVSDAQVGVIAEGYIRQQRPLSASAGGTRLALLPATRTAAAPSPIVPPDGVRDGAAVAKGAPGQRRAPGGSGVQRNPPAQPQPVVSNNNNVNNSNNSGAMSSSAVSAGCFFGATQPPVINSGTVNVCGACALGGSGCCACAANCPSQGATCVPGISPPYVGCGMPAGCTCLPSSCPGYTAASSSSAPPTVTCTDPPPPASFDFSTWQASSGSNDVPGSASTSLFNYIGGCLVFADDGTPASSNAADISFYVSTFDRYSAAGNAYYGAGDGMPMPMYVVPDAAPGTLQPLSGLVVVDVSAYQNHRRLEVKAGTSCMLVSYINAQAAPLVGPGSTVFSANADLSGYKRRGDGAGGWLAWDPNARALVWPVDQMTTWTVGQQAAGSGGCVQGRMINACDGVTAVPRRAVRVSVMDGAGTRAWQATTDAQGQYCANATINSFWAGIDLVTPQPPVHYFVSGSAITETAMCDPLPDGSKPGTQDCRTCQPGLAAAPTDLRLCTLCALTDPLPQSPSPYQFADTCALPPVSVPLRTATLTACSFCAASSAQPTAPPAVCTLSDGSTHDPTTQSCAAVDATLGYGLTAAGTSCQCKFAGSACNYATDQCCFVAPRDTSVRGLNQGGCKPGAINLEQGTCGRCTVSELGALCNAETDICCNGADPSVPLVCFDSTCVPARGFAN